MPTAEHLRVAASQPSSALSGTVGGMFSCQRKSGSCHALTAITDKAINHQLSLLSEKAD